MDSASHWQVPLASVTVKGQNVTVKSTDIILDTGSSLSYIPTADFNSLTDKITSGKSCSSSGGNIFCDCTTDDDNSYPTV
mmetsp:Transcript_30763/g.22858  ORF Transcript_30763/g.22858 Transcript_30763/m.22858 type:complete len:80 (-) Transcript_30763:669-908(-)